MNLSFDRLRTLWLVSRLGTLSAAAAELGITPSAVSQQLSALEAEVGAELLVPDGRSVALTPLGRHLAEQGGEMVGRLEQVGSEAEAMLDRVEGEFRISAVPSVALSVVAPAVVAINEQHPSIDLTVTDDEPHVSIDKLTSRRTDLSIVDIYPHAPLVVPDGVTSTVLGSEPLVLLAPESLGLPDEEIALLDVADQPWIVSPDFVSCGDAVLTACRAAGFEPNVRWETDDLLLVRGYVARGLGVSLQPRLAVDPPPEGAVVRFLANSDLHRDLVALTRDSAQSRPVQDLVLGALVDSAARQFVVDTVATSAPM